MDVDGLTEAEAWLLLEYLRWAGPPQQCPHCGAAGRCYFLNPGPAGRRTRTGSVTARRVWKCRTCRCQFSVLTGSVLEGTRLGLTTWIAAVRDWTSGPAGAPVLAVAAGSRGHVRDVLSAVEQVLGERSDRSR